MDFIGLQYQSTEDEQFYGLGLQPTVWDFKGKIVPILSSEGGVGRGLEPITTLVNIFASGGGGDTLTSYTASYSYITNTNKAVTLNSTAMGQYDFTKP